MSNLLGLVDALRSTLSKMEQVLGTVDEAIVWTDVGGRILWCNTPFDQLVGQVHILNLGSFLVDRLPLLEYDQDVPCQKHPARLALEPHNKGLGLYGLQRGAQRRVLEIAWSSFYEIEDSANANAHAPANTSTNTHANGEWSAVLVIRDVTERHQAEIELKQSKALLEEQIKALEQADARIRQKNEELSRVNIELVRANRLKNEFLATMSHELRTPLNAILGMTEGLSSGGFGALNERQQRSLSTIERNGRQLLNLITDILDMAKVGSGQLDLTIESVIADHLCQASVAMISPKAARKQIQVEIVVQPGLTEISVDHLQMRLVLHHLLDNAIKFTPAGGQVILKTYLEELESCQNPSHSMLINAASAEQCGYLCFAVSDTGIGIDEADLDRLFLPFTQLDSDLSRHYQGVGLGLFLVQQIAGLHGGNVVVQSTPGQGSCFTVRLPQCCPRDRLAQSLLQPSSESSLESSSQAASLESSPQPASQPTEAIAGTPSEAIAPSHPLPDQGPLLLLAGDNKALSISISSYLKAKGYSLLVASSGLEAITLAQLHRPQVLVVDSDLLQEEQHNILKHIRQGPGNPWMILLTGANPTTDHYRCFRADCDRVMTKPVNLKQLFAMVQELLADHPPNS